MGRMTTMFGSGALAGAFALAAGFGGTNRNGDEECERPIARGPAVCGMHPESQAPSGWTFAVEPKPLSAHVARGLDWLVAHQLENGGWGQGEESPNMGAAMEGFVAKADVADTAMATLALVRSGATPGAGPRGVALARGVDFVCSEVEASDADSLFVTQMRGTRVQMKIGTYVDTFLASMLLSEVKGRMAGPEENARVEQALAKVLAKIAKHQREDGGFEGSGWAPVLAQSMAGKGINRAYQAGASYDIELALENNAFFVGRAQAAAEPASPDDVALRASLAGESAGVLLYSLAANLGGLQDFVNSIGKRERELAELMEVETDTAKLAAFQEEKLALDDARRVQRDAQGAVVDRLDDPSFVSGFGSNGGEEFLSYMNISESLVVAGGEAWAKWDASMSANLDRVQNEDGSWTGHHCITGRTFVTSAALLTLMADRTPVPVDAVAKDAAGAAQIETSPVEVVVDEDDEE